MIQTRHSKVMGIRAAVFSVTQELCAQHCCELTGGSTLATCSCELGIEVIPLKKYSQSFQVYHLGTTNLPSAAKGALST